MKLRTIIALTAAVIAPTAVNSQQIDVSSMTCQQFVQSDDTRTNLIVAWLLGYYTDEQDPQVIDLSSLNKTRDRFVNFCKQQPNFKMTAAAEGLLEN
jgi:acid stress chaperone HdeB